MPKLRQPYINSVVIPVGATSAVIPIVNNDSINIWAIDQIAVTYSNGADQVNVSVNQDYFVPTAGTLFPSASGLTQTFAGQPSLYVESSNDVTVSLTITTIGGAKGGLATIYVQYRLLTPDDPELAGMF